MSKLQKIRTGWDAVSALDLDEFQDSLFKTENRATGYAALVSLATRLDKLANVYHDAGDVQSARVISVKAHSLWSAIQQTPLERLDKIYPRPNLTPQSPSHRQ